MNEEMMNKLFKESGENIRSIRRFQKISAKELAQEINISEGYLRNVECGARASLPIYLNIAIALKVSLNAIIPDFWVDEKRSKPDPQSMQTFIEVYSKCKPEDRPVLKKYIESFPGIFGNE